MQRYELILNQLSAKLQQLSLKKAEESEPWELISNPTVLEQPIAPNRKLIVLMGFLASIFFGYTLSLINEKRTGLIFSLDEFKSNIKYPFLKKLILSRKNECKEFLSIYKKSLKKENRFYWIN